MLTFKDFAVAVHESSHAVAALIEGATVHRVYINEGGGRCEHTGASPEERLVILAAGPKGEQLYAPGLAGAWGTSAGGDWADFDRLLAQFGSRRNRVQEDSCLRAERIVRQNGEAILLLADELMRRRSLSGDDVYRLFPEIARPSASAPSSPGRDIPGVGAVRTARPDYLAALCVFS